MAELEVVPDPEAAARAAADGLARAIEAARSARGVAHVALAGGTTPRRAYELLAGRLCDWTRVELWLGDERGVPDDDPEANATLVREALGAERLHAVGAGDDVAGAAERYERALRERVAAGADGVPVLDLVLLGLGEDGHTASLFPGAPALEEGRRLCLAVHGAPKPPPDRVTMTLPLLRAARARLFLAAGAGKAEAVQRALAGPDPQVPASLLGGEATTWIVDAAAAGR